MLVRGLDAAEESSRLLLERKGRPTTAARPATANPLQLLPEPTPARPLRGAGLVPRDKLHSASDPLTQQMWPIDCGSRANWASAPMREHLRSGVPGSNPVIMDEILLGSSHLTGAGERVPPSIFPPPRGRSAEYVKNRARIAATSNELTAPPLYWSRPAMTNYQESARPSSESGWLSSVRPSTAMPSARRWV